jgi:hypothetical protein
MYSAVNSIFRFSYSYPDYPTSGLTGTGLTRVYPMCISGSVFHVSRPPPSVFSIDEAGDVAVSLRQLRKTEGNFPRLFEKYTNAVT